MQPIPYNVLAGPLFTRRITWQIWIINLNIHKYKLFRILHYLLQNQLLVWMAMVTRLSNIKDFQNLLKKIKSGTIFFLKQYFSKYRINRCLLLLFFRYHYQPNWLREASKIKIKMNSLGTLSQPARPPSIPQNLGH